MINVCPQCQHNNPDTVINCQSCGAKVGAPCHNCGTTNPLSSQYCVECGVAQTRAPATPEPVVAKVPAITPEPVVAKAPEVVPEPVAVKAPVVAPEPVVAKAPIVAPEPVVAKAPVVAPEPVVDKTPVVAAAEKAPPEAVKVPIVEKVPVAEAPPPRPSAPTTNTPPPRMEPQKMSPVPGTRLQIAQATLVHLGSQERVELPIGKNLVFLGKPNDEIPPDIDVMRFAGSEIVSRIHALIHNVDDEAFYLEDAGSSNGTFLNDEPIKAGTRWRKRLQPGDTIALGKGGKVSFRFEIEE
ncbi:MAG: FHA domain-containing protein [Anaerolineae bacterium]|nr:FHA domain-containing protein [Gloeobacterales cyanobacterium ES-bin-313]